MARTSCSCGGPIVVGEGCEVCSACGDTRKAGEMSKPESKAFVLDRFCDWALWRKDNGGFDESDRDLLCLRDAIDAGEPIEIPAHWVRSAEEAYGYSSLAEVIAEPFEEAP